MATYIIGAIVVVIAAVIIRNIISNHKRKDCSCGCGGCKGCH